MHIGFLQAGFGKQTCREIMRRFEDVRAIVGMREKHRISNGQKEIDRKVLLPGYLFLYAKEAIDSKRYRQINALRKVLATDSEVLELKGSDREFARWLDINDGIMGRLRLKFKDGILKSIKGPMEFLAKEILRIDKYTRNADGFSGQADGYVACVEFVDN